MTFLKQFVSMSTSERGGTQFKEFTGINKIQVIFLGTGMDL